MFEQKTLPGFSDAISSPESQAGISHCPSQDGTDQSGQQAVPVSRSVQRGSKRGRKTNGTSGPSSSVSSMPSDLPSFSVSRFLQRSVTAGLMEYSQIWKERVTPAGRRYWEHTASGHRTSGSDCTGLAVGYSTPTVTDEKRGGLPPRPTDTGVPLTQQVAGYGTPRVTNNSCIGNPSRSESAKSRLEDQVAGWANASTRDWKDTGDLSGSMQRKDGKLRNDTVPRQAHGLITQSASSVTESRGVLDAAFSRWLMGFPQEWDEASPNWQAWCDVQAAIVRGG